MLRSTTEGIWRVKEADLLHDRSEFEAPTAYSIGQEGGVSNLLSLCMWKELLPALSPSEMYLPMKLCVTILNIPKAKKA